MFDLQMIFRKAEAAVVAAGRQHEFDEALKVYVRTHVDWSARVMFVEVLRDSTVGLGCVADEILREEQQLTDPRLPIVTFDFA
jgi:hypothetical protein